MSDETVTPHDAPPPEPAYDGPAHLLVRGDDDPREVEVQVTLRGRFQPIDGRYRWYGRVRSDTDLSETVRPGSSVLLRTPYGEAEARLSDLDPWGRFRVSGTGRPPFPADTEPTLAE
jgi:hypothetical protein